MDRVRRRCVRLEVLDGVELEGAFITDSCPATLGTVDDPGVLEKQFSEQYRELWGEKFDPNAAEIGSTPEEDISLPDGGSKTRLLEREQERLSIEKLLEELRAAAEADREEDREHRAAIDAVDVDVEKEYERWKAARN